MTGAPARAGVRVMGCGDPILCWLFPPIWSIIPSLAQSPGTQVTQDLSQFSARCEHTCPSFPSANMEKEYPNARHCNASPLPASEDHSIPRPSKSDQYQTFWRYSMAVVG